MSRTSQKIKLNNSSGETINPATEETLLSVAGFSIPKYDYISASYPDNITDVYTYKIGGSSGTVVCTITVVYTDLTKEFLLSVTKS